MTIREYIEDNVEDVVADLCQYQNCDNCSIGGFNWKRCPLKNNDVSVAIDMEFDNGQCGDWEDEE